MVKATLAAALCALTAVVPAAAQAPVPATAAAHEGSTLLARGFGRSRGFGSRSRGFGQRRTRGRGIFRHILRALALGYLLHLLFTTPGGLIVLVFIVVLVMLLMRRLRARRISYRY